MVDVGNQGQPVIRPVPGDGAGDDPSPEDGRRPEGAHLHRPVDRASWRRSSCCRVCFAVSAISCVLGLLAGLLLLLADCVSGFARVYCRACWQKWLTRQSRGWEQRVYGIVPFFLFCFLVIMW